MASISKKLSGAIQLDSTSDALFASLFLPVPHWHTKHYELEDDIEGSIPWKYCDRILSLFQDPRFNSREVSFKDYGDMFRCIGKKREEAWSIVEARPRDSGTIPYVVVDSVFRFIREEMEEDLRPDSFNIWDRTGSPWPSELRGRDMLSRSKHCFQNWMLVHSSWYSLAKRLLIGYRATTEELNPNFVQNPLLGSWTRELHIAYEMDEDKYSMFPPSPDQPHAHLLVSLCERIPAVRLVRIFFNAYELLHDTYKSSLRNALVALVTLEELHFNVASVLPLLQSLVSIASDTHHPTLRFLGLYTQDFDDDYLDFPEWPSILSPLAALPRLQSIHLACDTPRDTDSHIFYSEICISGAAWSRVPSHLDSSSPFTLEMVRIGCPSDGLTDEAQEKLDYRSEMLLEASLVEFCFDVQAEESRHPDEIQRTNQSIEEACEIELMLCTSARSIIFRGLPWTHVGVIDRLGLPRNIEEFTLITPFPTSYEHYWADPSHPLYSKESEMRLLDDFVSNDTRLANALARGLAPSLRTLKLFFSGDSFEKLVELLDHELEHNREPGERSGDKLERSLSQCRRICAERKIKLCVGCDRGRGFYL